jgi:hypothetical protein
MVKPCLSTLELGPGDAAATAFLFREHDVPQRAPSAIRNSGCACVSATVSDTETGASTHSVLPVWLPAAGAGAASAAMHLHAARLVTRLGCTILCADLPAAGCRPPAGMASLSARLACEGASGTREAELKPWHAGGVAPCLLPAWSVKSRQEL